jgi:hypothetical protein
LLALGAVVLLTRKSGNSEWSVAARVLITGAPSIVLYMLAIAAGGRPQSSAGEPWRSVLLVVSILLGTVALFEVLQWTGADTGNTLWIAGVFAVSGVFAAYGAWRAIVPYAALLAGLAVLTAWLLVCAKIAGDPSVDTVRWLLVAGGVLLFAGAVAVARAKAVGAGEIATVGGIAAVAAGVLGVFVGLFVGVGRGIVNSLSSAGLSRASSRVSGIEHVSGLQSFGWDLYLLVVSLALVWVGSRIRARGLGYVGGAGLLAFVISVGAQITRIESGRAPSTSLSGWPLVLLGLGAIALIVPLFYRRDR